jgi:hypothetical protein
MTLRGGFLIGWRNGVNKARTAIGAVVTTYRVGAGPSTRFRAMRHLSSTAPQQVHVECRAQHREITSVSAPDIPALTDRIMDIADLVSAAVSLALIESR